MPITQTGQVGWDEFFRNFSRQVDDQRPFGREKIYAELRAIAD